MKDDERSWVRNPYVYSPVVIVFAGFMAYQVFLGSAGRDGLDAATPSPALVAAPMSPAPTVPSLPELVSAPPMPVLASAPSGEPAPSAGGEGGPEPDSDGDGSTDDLDQCPGPVVSGAPVGANGCPAVTEPTPTYAISPEGKVLLNFPNDQALTLLIASDFETPEKTAEFLRQWVPRVGAHSPGASGGSLYTHNWSAYEYLEAQIAGCTDLGFATCVPQSKKRQPTGGGQSKWFWHWSLVPKAAPESVRTISIEVAGITKDGRVEPIPGIPPINVTIALHGATWMQIRLREAAEVVTVLTAFLKGIPGLLTAIGAIATIVLTWLGYKRVAKRLAPN